MSSFGTLVAVPHDPHWATSALCKGRCALFFGPPGERPTKRHKRETLARAYCQVCPVQAPCRDQARIGRENGLWGDENEEQRAALGYLPRATERRAVAEAARCAKALVVRR